MTEATQLSRLADVRTVDLPRHARDDGEVVVAEAAGGVPFAIARLFVLRAPEGAERGHHAHRLCSQFLICSNGAVDVVLDDGAARQTFTLDRSNRALLVPPMIWNTVVFRAPQSVVSVLCDRPYEADDYVRDYQEFMQSETGSGSLKFVVTGALGHIGSAFIRGLPALQPGAEIVMIDNLSTQRYPSLFKLPAIGRYRFLDLDVRDVDLRPHFEDAYAVVHLAAKTDAAGSVNDAAAVEANNFQATEKVAAACVVTGARMIHLSSTSVYGTQQRDRVGGLLGGGVETAEPLCRHQAQGRGTGPIPRRERAEGDRLPLRHHLRRLARHALPHRRE